MTALKDISGQRFGHWTVLKRGEKLNTKVGWFCKCDCGTRKTVDGAQLRNGRSKSCGCVRNQQTSNRTRAELVGQRFGKLVVKRLVKIKESNQIWECKCDCGGSNQVSTHALRSGNTSSCGSPEDRKSQRGDLKGVRYGSLTAVRFCHNRIKNNGNKGEAYWAWRCDCGEEITAPGAGVRNRFEKRGWVACIKCAAKKRAALRTNDYTNKRFGMLVGIRQVDLSKSPATASWLWKCDCGKRIKRTGTIVQNNPRSHCGCQPGGTAADRTGERFGMLVALRRIGKKPGETTYLWEFRCDCGNLCEARLRDAVSGLQASCGCRKGGYDSLATWIAGEFREAEADSFFYVYPLARFAGFSKPGIAEDLEARAGASRGEYGELHDFIALPRIESWLIEQAVLRSTHLMAECPQELTDKKWEGYSEVRKIEPSKVFEIAVEFHEQLQELGREEFAIRYLVTTPSERKQLEVMKHF